MEGFPEDLVQTRLVQIRETAHALRRYTSLNHLASSARPVLMQEEQAEQLLTDMESLDLDHILSQVLLVCDCPRERILTLFQEFKVCIFERLSLFKWSEWLKSVRPWRKCCAGHACEGGCLLLAHTPTLVLLLLPVSPCQVLRDFVDGHPNPVAKAKRFLPRWSMLGSVILRDLTLRSASSFGSFHLVRLLLDEFMIFLVEQMADKV
jgi:hypothetical protein